LLIYGALGSAILLVTAPFRRTIQTTTHLAAISHDFLRWLDKGAFVQEITIRCSRLSRLCAELSAASRELRADSRELREHCRTLRNRVIEEVRRTTAANETLPKELASALDSA
jgi:hypothetical protein